MPLPTLDSTGELPEGVHQATIAEIIARFGSGTPQRQAITTRLLRIYHLAQATGELVSSSNLRVTLDILSN
ncbi:MAG: hypothetical protein QME81_02525 [bacterium]|nr:hypothetical protein [bacterium]